jgi:ATP-dependent Clp protease ATP-binding subunit ClpA
MKLTLPLLVQESHRPGSKTPVYSVRPLFFAGPIGRGEHLSRAMTKLAQEVRKRLDDLGKQLRHDGLLPWTFCPTVEEHHLKAKLVLRRGTADCRALVISFAALERKLAMMPAVPDRWFEVARGAQVLDRAREVLTDHLNQLQKESEQFVVPASLTSGNKQWVSSVDLDIRPKADFAGPADGLLALLGGAGKLSGRAELQKVGRCLDWLYPDELDRTTLRDAEVSELETLLSGNDRRPVLLLGPPRVGKTAILHDCVFRRVHKARSPYVYKKNVWLLSPPRLISGMIYVGQWEGRVNAIIEEAAKHDHVLYFDDVLGLYSAGRSRDSDLTVADVLRPHVERREFRLLAEMTPEAFRVLQEHDRGLADQFHVLPIQPTDEKQTRQVLVAVRRQLEGRHRCRYHLDVLPLVLDLSNRYMRESAQPGKSAQFFRQLAIKHAGKDVQREQVLGEFRDRSGLSLDFLNDRARLRREDVIESLRRRISGQDEAIAAMADAICIAKARLNDPGRPLATFLFLGPTGVGKTECAKAVCQYLFGDERRLLRFDMNEYLDAASPARLTGTFRDPEGLLTAAIRRQPFSVVLLDEIEKAHAGIFDLLLQVLGEGRLTDALGRTADFGNAIIIMTSNLGAREARASFGLRSATQSDRSVYVAAAERFFRPEFFNRIDRLVPFERLTREQIAGVAHRLIGQLLQRDGLVHRRCVLAVDPAAIEKVIDQGFHPDLGARALKRSLERQLTQPVAARLAAVAPDAPALIHLLPAREGIAVRIDALAYAPRRPLSPPGLDLADWDTVLDCIESAIDRVDDAITALEPPGQLTQGTLSTGHYRYLAVRELIEQLRRTVERLDHLGSTPQRGAKALPKPRTYRHSRKLLAMNDLDTRLALRAAADVASQMAAMESEPAEFGDSLADQLVELIGETAMLDVIAGSADAESRCLLWLRSPHAEADGELDALVSIYQSLFSERLGFIATAVPAKLDPAHPCERALLLEMPGIAPLMSLEQGTHLFTGKDRKMSIVQAIITTIGDRDPADLLAEQRCADQSWRAELRGGIAEPAKEPFPLLPVLRVYDTTGLTIDARSGLAVRGLPSSAEMRKFVLSQAPWPAEVGL